MCTEQPSATLHYELVLLYIRYLSRFFDRWAHETMYAYIGNKHFFTKSCHCQTYQNSKISWQKMPISDFQSEFSMSKIIRIFLNFFFIEEYQFRSIFVVIDIFWKLQFLNHFVTKIMPIFQSSPAKRTLICQKKIFYEKVLFSTQFSHHLMRKLLKKS